MIDYLKENLWLLWTLVSVLALILEVSSGTFYLICFAIGAACVVVASLLGLPLWVQVLVFAVFSAVSVYGVRPFVYKYLHREDAGRASNADALIGREGVVVEPITPQGAGYVRIDGDEWKAVIAGSEPLDKGARVRVVARESIIVTVEKL